MLLGIALVVSQKKFDIRLPILITSEAEGRASFR